MLFEVERLGLDLDVDDGFGLDHRRRLLLHDPHLRLGVDVSLGLHAGRRRLVGLGDDGRVAGSGEQGQGEEWQQGPGTHDRARIGQRLAAFLQGTKQPPVGCVNPHERSSGRGAATIDPREKRCHPPSMQPAGINPYAPPRANLTAPTGTPSLDYYEEDGCLVVRGGSVLPPLCVRTGERAEGKLKSRTVRQIPGWTIVVFVLVSPIIGALLMLAMQRTFRVTMAISDRARASRRVGIVTGLAISGVSILVLVFAGRFGVRLSAVTIFLGMWMIWIGLAVAMFMNRPYKIARSAGDYVYLQLHAEALYEFERYKQEHVPAPAPAADPATPRAVRAGYPF